MPLWADANAAAKVSALSSGGQVDSEQLRPAAPQASSQLASSSEIYQLLAPGGGGGGGGGVPVHLHRRLKFEVWVLQSTTRPLSGKRQPFPA